MRGAVLLYESLRNAGILGQVPQAPTENTAARGQEFLVGQAGPSTPITPLEEDRRLVDCPRGTPLSRPRQRTS